MNCMNPTSIAIFLELQAFRIVFLVLRSGIIAAFADCTSQRDHNAIFFTFSHLFLRSLGGPG